MMIDLSVNFCDIKSPNPFWLASGPATNTAKQVERAFDMGWGGAVWKTFGITTKNVSPRYASIDYFGYQMMGINNIELITDRSTKENLYDIMRVKKRFPKNPLIASLMVESKRSSWHKIVREAEDAGVDGLELNFSCPHGMSEHGMGSAVGQVPKYTKIITGWVKEVAKTPVIVKLTPNVTDITKIGLAACKGGADGLSLINTITSIIGVDLDTLEPKPTVGGFSTYGGYAGPAIKPIALHLVSKIASHPKIRVPISGIGGISEWRDAVEFILLGATTVQVCTAVMHYGFGIVKDLIGGLSKWMKEKGYKRIEDFRGKTLERIKVWSELDLNYKVIARINSKKCNSCLKCYIACRDTINQSIRLQKDNHKPQVIKRKCIGCGLCAIVCPIENCVTLVPVDII